MERGNSLNVSNVPTFGAVPFHPMNFAGRPGMRIPSMRVKLSTRWIEEYSSRCERVFDLPYIDKAAKESIFNVARWRCHPMQMVGTLVSTKASRLMRILETRFKRRQAKAFREIAFSAAAVSVITQSNWVIDRFLGVSRVFSKKKISHAIVQGSVRRLDDIQRFVYSQVWKQTNWLTSWSERPSDKSKGSRYSLSEDQRFFLDPPVACSCRRSSCLYGAIPNPGRLCAPTLGGYQNDTQADYSDW